jgi:excisionase family DNA binding protein
MKDGHQKQSIVSVTEAARLLGVSRVTVMRYIHSDILPCTNYPGTGKRPIRRIECANIESFRLQYKQLSQIKVDGNIGQQCGSIILLPK